MGKNELILADEDDESGYGKPFNGYYGALYDQMCGKELWRTDADEWRMQPIFDLVDHLKIKDNEEAEKLTDKFRENDDVMLDDGRVFRVHSARVRYNSDGELKVVDD